MAHSLYNLLLLAADLAALIAVARRPGPVRLAAGAVLVGLLGGLAAFPLARVGGLHSFGALALLAWAAFVHVPLVLAGGAWLLRKTRRGWAALAAACAVAVVLVAVDAFFVEPRWLEVRRVRIESAKLERPIRIVVLADIQTDAVGAYERRAIERAMAEEPDLLLLPGDYVQVAPYDSARATHQREALREAFAAAGLAAPMGVYAVGGNCEPPGWPQIFAGLPVHVFERTGTLELDGLTITGLDLRDAFRTDGVIESSERFHVVLGHAPDFALGDVRADLLVAGHCHGGQVRLPWIGPLITLSRVPRAWASGVREIRPGTWLAVSRGVGMEGGHAPRLRFLCRPEVLVLELVPAGAEELAGS